MDNYTESSLARGGEWAGRKTAQTNANTHLSASSRPRGWTLRGTKHRTEPARGLGFGLSTSHPTIPDLRDRGPHGHRGWIKVFLLVSCSRQLSEALVVTLCSSLSQAGLTVTRLQVSSLPGMVTQVYNVFEASLGDFTRPCPKELKRMDRAQQWVRSLGWLSLVY